MFYISVSRGGPAFVPHVILKASTPEGCQVVEAVAMQQGYRTSVVSEPDWRKVVEADRLLISLEETDPADVAEISDCKEKLSLLCLTADEKVAAKKSAAAYLHDCYGWCGTNLGRWFSGR